MMEYPNLLIAIRNSGKPQYVIAQAAGIREPRFSQIVRHGGAKWVEQEAISRALAIEPSYLFGKSSLDRSSDEV